MSMIRKVNTQCFTLEKAIDTCDKKLKALVEEYTEKDKKKMREREEKILAIIDEHADEIKAFGRDIWTHAELGYREKRTSEKAVSMLKKYGVDAKTGLAITGFKGYLNNKKAEGFVW